jgi:hypothetical protein
MYDEYKLAWADIEAGAVSASERAHSDGPDIVLP